MIVCNTNNRWFGCLRTQQIHSSFAVWYAYKMKLLRIFCFLKRNVWLQRQHLTQSNEIITQTLAIFEGRCRKHTNVLKMYAKTNKVTNTAISLWSYNAQWRIAKVETKKSHMVATNGTEFAEESWFKRPNTLKQQSCSCNTKTKRISSIRSCFSWPRCSWLSSFTFSAWFSYCSLKHYSKSCIFISKNCCMQKVQKTCDGCVLSPHRYVCPNFISLFACERL